jgi:hypothetical protein
VLVYYVVGSKQEATDLKLALSSLTEVTGIDNAGSVVQLFRPLLTSIDEQEFLLEIDAVVQAGLD